ncbi:MAG: HlyC/CorC family transporter [Pedosphaera sp.]|nr:HlyC/CorC family transporter [Pedosphaera sp.]
MSVSGVLVRVLAVFGLVLANGFFVASELALVKVRRTQLDILIANGNRRALVARRVIDNLDAAISATQLGITLVTLALGGMVELVFGAMLDPFYDSLHVDSTSVRKMTTIGVGFLINCYLLIVIGELAPKAIAIRKTVPVAVWTARPLMWFRSVTYPFVWLLNLSAQWLLVRLGVESLDKMEQGHSEEELRLLLGVGRDSHGVVLASRDIVLNALDLRQRTARQVMRHRQEITFLDTEATMVQCIEMAERTRYSRFPLCDQGNVDKSIGVVHFKDLFALRNKAKCGADLRLVARKIIYVPETARLENLLRLFLDRKLHLAIVVDEYGGTVGLVTLENILEEVVGQIQDEFDQEKPLIQKIGDEVWEVDGAWPLHELAEFVATNLEEEDVTTTSGWLTHRLGGFAKTGDSVRVGDFELRVEELDGLRVSKLRLTRVVKPAVIDA